jgi:hypothetical protein
MGQYEVVKGRGSQRGEREEETRRKKKKKKRGRGS